MTKKLWIVLFALSISTNAFGAPPVINDLAAGTPTANSIPLSWSVSTGGPATAYELRYSTTPFETGSFASAVPLGGVPAPTGGTESNTVSGLACGTRYWFGVMAYDAAGATAVSNVAGSATLPCTPSFASSAAISGASGLYAFTKGDFNNDGKIDLAFTVHSGTTGNIIFYPGDGSGGFGTPVTSNAVTGYYPLTPTAGDFNRDGKLDLAVPNFFGNSASILLGNGAGGFANSGTISTGTEPQNIAVNDFNRDGNPDIAVALWGGHVVSVFLGDGNGGFSSKDSYGGYGTGSWLHSARTADLDGDGILDIVVADHGSEGAEGGNTVGFLKGNGDGSFVNAVNYTVGRQPGFISIADFNRDGRPDLVATSLTDEYVSVLMGSGGGTFAAAVDYPIGIQLNSSAIDDYNGDGINDILVSGSDSASLFLLTGKVDGTFNSAVSFPVGANILSLVSNDFNGDGKPDVVALASGQTSVYSVLNTATWSPAGNFAPTETYASGGNQHGNPGGTHRLTGASFERNGKIDLVVTNHWDGNVSKLKGNGDGTFATAVNYGAGTSPFDIIAGDFSRDGVPDLAVVNHWGQDISLLKGQGDGTFEGAANYGVGTVPTSMVSGDFNRDGIPDFAVTNRDSNNVSILIGQSGGGYQAAVNYGIGGGYHHIVAADLDGNGTLDLALSNSDDDTVSVLLGDGDGIFQGADNYGSGGDYPREVITGDFNGDGRPDLAVVNTNSNNAAVLLGTGGGAFASAVTYPVGTAPVPLAVADINRDGKQDLVAGNYGANSISILYGKGDGAFHAAQDFPAVTPHGLFIGDFNNDGKPDISTASWEINGVSVLLNAAPLPTVPQQGLSALWRAENNPLDSIGGNHGILQNGVTFAAGRYGQAFSLDGANDFIEIPNSHSLNPSSAITVEAWYRPVSFAGNGSNAIVSKGASNHIEEPYYEYHLGVNGDQYISPNSRPASFSFTVSPGGTRVAIETAANTWVPGNWYHLVGTYDGAHVRLYVNGVLQASAPATGTLNDYGKSVRIGAFNNISSPIDYTPGVIDEVAIYSRALTVNEIATMSAQVPNAFSLIDQTGVPINTYIQSNPITVTGINIPTAISITGGDYAISTDGGSTWGGWSNTAGTVSLNNQVKLRQQSSSNNLVTTTATLTIGGVNGTFSVTTAAATEPQAVGLVAWWKGENNAYDSVGGNHGTLQNGATFAAGRVGQAFSFDGVDDYVDTGSYISIKGHSRRSIHAWIMVNSFDGKNQPVFVETIGGYEQIHDVPVRLQLMIRPDGSIEISGRDSDEFASAKRFARSGTGAVPAGQFVHIAGSYDGIGGENKVFVNGVDVTASTEAGGVFPDTEPTVNPRIGNDTTDSFNGFIDELHVYNRNLSATEVSKLAGTYPDEFTFTPQMGVNRSTVVESNTIKVSGITNPASISIDSCTGTTCQYQINSSDWTSTASTVNNGDTVKVHMTSSSDYSTTTIATLKIGGREGTFSVTTLEGIKPEVTNFFLTESESYDMIVKVSSFTATDNSGIISGYLITTSNTPPSSSDPAWSVNAPTTFTLTTAGINTLYAWAKDPAGNVSEPLTDTVLLKPVRRGTSTFNYYESISSAYSAASSGETINSLAVTVPGSVTITGKTLTIKGGHADGYGSQPGVTTIQGTLTIGTGSLIVDRVAVR